MPSYLQQVFSLLTTLPGNLVYHIILAFSVVGALQVGLSHGHTSRYPQVRRTNTGLFLLLLAQLSLFASSALVWGNSLSSHALIPPFDRAISLLSLIVIVWIWAFPGSSRFADTATSLLILLVAAGLVFSLNWWRVNNMSLDFNQSWPESIGSLLGIIISLGGILTLGIRRPNGWGTGMGMLLILGTGYLLHWFFPNTGDYSGVLRLAQIAAFPLLLALPQRIPVLESPAAGADQGTRNELTPEPVTKIKPRYSTDPKVMHSLLELASQRSAEKACRLITRLVSQMMLADLCLLISIENNSSLVVSCGFDLIREIPIEGFPLDIRSSPVIASALRRSKHLRLPASSNSLDMQGLSHALNMNRVGHLLLVSFSQSVGTSNMGLILLSPYSNRSWTQEDQTNLSNFTSTIRDILQRSQQLYAHDKELDQNRESLAASQMRVEQLDRENEKLRSDLAYSQEQIAYTSARAEGLAAMLASQSTEHAANSKGYHPLYKETDRPAWMHPPNIGQEALPITVPQEHLNMLNAIVQELRQPMSSIVGYTDLLLGESIGILGATQKKFLDRIKSSIERMNSLVDDLANSTTTERLTQSSISVNLSQVIDDAIAQCATQLRDKNIVMRVDLPEQLPEIQANYDALYQILFHMLQNAGVATPNEGNITLRVRIENEASDSGYTLIQIADSGAGISPENLTRVFSRLNRTDSASKQGLGDNGVGLAIVQTLVEALGGRIWVDSEVGHGATYSVLLPLCTKVEPGERA